MSPNSFDVEASIDVNAQDGGVDDARRTQRVAEVRTRQSVAHVIDSRHQTKKDTKSIGQNLYDSVSVIYSYSKSITSPLLALHAMRAPSGDTRLDQRTRSANESPLANATVAIARQNSQENLRAQSQAHAPRDQPEVLSNGQLVHKVPYRPTTSDQAASLKHTDNASPDLATGRPKMSITRTGRKSFTLGGTIVPAVAKPKPAPASEPLQHNALKPDQSRPTTIPTASNLSCDILNQFRDEVHKWQDSGLAYRPAAHHSTPQWDHGAETFVNRSLFYTLGHAETLLQSFRESNEAFQRSPLAHLDSARLVHSFRDWSQHTGALIFESLSVAVDALLIRPPALEPQTASESDPKPNDRSAAGSTKYKAELNDRPRYLNNHEAAHIVMICIHALTSSVPVGWPRTWAQLRSLRSWGVIIPSATADADHFVDPYINIIDALEYEPAVMLADRLLRAIGVRSCFDHVIESMHQEAVATGSTTAAPEESLSSILIQHLEVVERVALDNKRKLKPATANKDPGWTVTATFVEWLKTIIVKKWDGNIEISKWSSVGAAVILLHNLRKHIPSPLQAIIDNGRQSRAPAQPMVSDVQDPISPRTHERCR